MMLTQGIEGRFDWRRVESLGYAQVYDGLKAFDRWLQPNGWRFVQWNHLLHNGPDDIYTGFVVAEREWPTLRAAAKAAKLNFYTLNDPAPVDAHMRVTDLLPDGNSLQQALTMAAANAPAGLRPCLWLTAQWCELCKALAALLAEDLRLQRSLRGAHLLRIDFDAWGDQLASVGVSARSVPHFEWLDSGLRGTTRTMGGDAWSEDTVEKIAPVFERFFSAEAGLKA